MEGKEITKSVCPECLKEVDARIVTKNGKVFLQKKCKQHGNFLLPHIWNEENVYNIIKRMNSETKNYGTTAPNPNGIIVDITAKCNLSCPFCFGVNAYGTKFQDKPKSKIIQEIIDAQKKINFSCVYLFGGEPTLREDIFEIIKKIKKLKLEVYLFTNGIKLSDHSYVRALKRAGLDYTVLQFDSTENYDYEQIRGKGILKQKIMALENLKKESIDTNLFVVILQGINEKEIEKIVSLPARYSNIRSVYLSTITLEGRYSPIMKPVSNSARFEILKKELNLTDEDFLVSTLFDHKIAQFVENFTKKPVQRISPNCDLVCYFYSLNPRPVSLARIIDMNSLVKWLDECNVFLNKKSISYPRLFTRSVALIFNKKIRYKAIFLHLISSSFISVILHSLGYQIHNNFNKIFRVVVTQFQDRYNLDAKSLKGCNIFSICSDGTLRPLCEKIIHDILCGLKSAVSCE